MVPAIFIGITAFTASLIILPLVIRYATKNNLFVEPSKRRIHTKVTPSMGGIAIFSGLAISLLAWTSGKVFSEITLFLLVLSIPFFVGFLDDLVHLRPAKKILGQALAAALVYFVLDVKIGSLQGMFGIHELTPVVSFGVTVICIILLTNSFNLIDGIDGLAGTFSLIALLFFGTWFYLTNAENYAVLCFAMMGSILAFLTHNWQPSSIFMGDTGSLVIGMTLAVLAISFIDQNADLPAASEIKFNGSIATAICILIIPIVDTVRVVFIRLYLRLSPLTADKRHIHHALVRLGKSHRMAVLILTIIHFVFIAIAIGMRDFNNLYVLTTTLLFALVLCVILDRLIHLYSSKKTGVPSALKRKIASHI